MEKILIIDDEPFIRENVERILHEDGYQVLSAEDAGPRTNWSQGKRWTLSFWT